MRTETITKVNHLTEDLFTFTTTRSPSMRFESGQFTMIGLEVDGKPVMRPYSIVSATYDDFLEFLSIKVPNGTLTKHLRNVIPGTTLLMGDKATGTLMIDNLKPGRNLYLLATGTGIAPFISLARDTAVYDKFEKVVIVHGCRYANELAYRGYLQLDIRNDPLVGDRIQDQLFYYPTVTREPFRNMGRITEILRNRTLTTKCGLPPIDHAKDRAMICGNMDLTLALRDIVREMGFTEGSSHDPGEYVTEKSFIG